MRIILTFLTLVLAVMLVFPPGAAAKARAESRPKANEASSAKSGKKTNPSQKITRKKGKG